MKATSALRSAVSPKLPDYLLRNQNSNALYKSVEANECRALPTD
jgi:hypothetical protein